jgi:hypothetical protein
MRPINSQLHYPDDDRPEYAEYRLPGDEPMKHQPDTNVQFDWFRHQPKSEQKRLSPTGDHAAAWDKKQVEIDMDWRADSIKAEEDYDKKARQAKLPGISLAATYSKKRARNIKNWRKKKGQ